MGPAAPAGSYQCNGGAPFRVVRRRHGGGNTSCAIAIPCLTPRKASGA